MKKKEKIKGMNEKRIKRALQTMVKRGYLKKVGSRYQDSDKVTQLIKKGKSRQEISKILEVENKKIKR